MKYFNKCLAVLLKPWVMILTFVFIIASYSYIDRPLALYIHEFNISNKLPFVYWITCLGITQAYLIILPLIAIICRFVLKSKSLEMRVFLVWFCVLFPSLISLILKMVLGRARPELLFDQSLFGFYGWHMQKAYFSFPSGHVTAITSFLTGLLILYPRHRYFYIVIGLLVIVSRVLLTCHYLSDVVATFYLVFLELGSLFYVIKRYYPTTWGLMLK